MNIFAGRTAVVTGAASGMGRALSTQLAARGARLALCDVDSARLAQVSDLCEANGAGDVFTRNVNVAEREAVHQFADDVAEHFGAVHFVFNNAGIGAGASVEKIDYKDFERVIDIDFWGVVYGTKAFLPHLIASGDGHVINTSSSFGLVAGPYSSSYNAAKFAVRGFTESLRIEMLVGKHPVAVSCVHPGGIKTDIFKNTHFEQEEMAATFTGISEKFVYTTAEKAAEIILEGTEKRKARILVGPDAYFYDALARVLGSGYQRPAAMLARRVIPKSLRDI